MREITEGESLPPYICTIITSTLGTWASNSSGSFDPPKNVSSINVLVNLNKLGFRKEIFSIIMLPGVVNDT